MPTLPGRLRRTAMIHMQPDAVISHFPHKRMEAWKWTDLRMSVSEEHMGLTRAVTPRLTLPDGVSCSPGNRHDGSSGVMPKLAAGFAPVCWNIRVPTGLNVQGPLRIDNLSGGHACMFIRVDKGASLDIEEYHQGPDRRFSNMDLQVHLAEGSRLRRVVVQNDPGNAVRVATACIAAEKHSILEQYMLSFGGALSRLETRLYSEGEGIEATMNGAYLLDGRRHTDMTGHVEIAGSHCTVRQSVKGVVTDKSRGVFQGKFHVKQAAQHTDARMRHDALMLSDTTEVRARPELEIYADDVACAHGNTIGALDENVLFYMRQRGIPQARSRSMLTEAFVAEAFDDLDDAASKQSLLTRVQEWLA